MNKKLKVFHAFSGIDSQYMAEKRVWKDNVELVGTMEVDADAIISSALVHENDKFYNHYKLEWTENQYRMATEWLQNRNIGFDFDKNKSKLIKMKKDKIKQLYIASVCNKNYGDISLANKKKLKDEIDLFTYSFCCQDISVAGKQCGLTKDSGTRSSLLWECEKFIKINKPKFLLLENVKNLVGKKFIKDFENWLSILDKLGYVSYFKVLNSKDFNIPQNRERVFCLSIRKDIDKGYEFPIGKGINKCINDVLEDDVDDKYYLSKEIVDRFKIKEIGNNIIGNTSPKFRTIGQRDLVYKNTGVMGTLTATDYKQPKQIICEQRTDEGLRTFKNNICGTLRTIDSCGDKRIVNPKNLTIRKLTPKECFRLMDFDEDAFDKVKDYISDTQLYKISGNSIVVKCLEEIFKNLNKQYNLGGRYEI